jgi:crotonobetainyl-CoA:carnitine CoA-transferase CaiB-like acyl-CoA transferase
MTSAALSHLRICDFSGQLAGAGATRTLAAFGAQVIRIEDPVQRGRWDILRGVPPFVDERKGIDLGGPFNNHNVEKLGITINLRTGRGRELIRRLVAISDVVTENFAPGVLARLGFPYDELRAIRPDIVYVSNSGFGHRGPYGAFKSWGPIAQAVCGLTYTSGLPHLPPAGWGYSYMDHHGGNFMAIAVLAALVHRTRTGEGQWIDMSAVEAGITLDGPALLDFAVNGRPVRRDGMPHSNHSQYPLMAPHNIYAAKGDDNWVAIACRDDDDWGTLGRVIAEPWCFDARLAARDGRLAHEQELDGLVEAWTRARDRFDVAAALQAAGLPAVAVTRPEDRIDNDSATAAWGLWPVAHHREMGDVRVDGLPVHLSATDWEITRGGPCLGEHNDVVFGEILGLPRDEIAELRDHEVI